MGIAYCNQSDVTNLIDAVNLAAMTDDYAQGALNTTVLTNVILMASNACDALVSSIYAVPFTSNVPAKIKDASIIFTCEALYARRLTPDEKNPFKSRADYWRKELMLINAGELSLDESFNRGFVPIAYVSTPSRVNTNFY